MIDLRKFFHAIQEHAYAVIKIADEFPAYTPGSDIDIFCLNTEQVAKAILAVGHGYTHSGYTIEVHDLAYQIQIDFMLNKKIDFRFDVYRKLPEYDNIHIKPALFESIVENRVKKTIEDSVTIYVPGIVDDLLIRYIEYQEWYGRRPDKIKHIDYINDYITDRHLKNTFLNKLHHYTALGRGAKTRAGKHGARSARQIPRAIIRCMKKTGRYVKKIIAQ